MMGWTKQYKSKKALREAEVGKEPRFLETSLHGEEYKGDGTYVIVGPDPYTNRKWYAQVTVQDGLVTKVK
jgi:hypothetical protein